MKKIICAIIMVLVAGLVSAQSLQELAKKTDAMIYKDQAGKTLLYRQYVTPGLPANTKVPLVILLHGAGERGNDNLSQMLHGFGAIVSYSQTKKMPLVLIAPQCPKGKQWVDTPWVLVAHRMPPQPSESMELAMGLLEDRCKTLPIDLKRIYITGLSMGGYGTWDFVQRKPELFAAALPICGGGDTTLAWKIRNVPIWTFHGSADDIVPVDRSRSMVSALWTCKGNIRYREYPNAGHGVWGPTYADHQVLNWFFSQKKK